MTKAINNYDKTKISMAHVFLQYDQATMIHKYSLDYHYLSDCHRHARGNLTLIPGVLAVLRLQKLWRTR